MELEITTTIWIDTDEIIRIMKDKNWSIDHAIEDYILCLDDCDYYVIGYEEKEKIKNYLTNNNNLL